MDCTCSACCGPPSLVTGGVPAHSQGFGTSLHGLERSCMSLDRLFWYIPPKALSSAENNLLVVACLKEVWLSSTRAGAFSVLAPT